MYRLYRLLGTAALAIGCCPTATAQEPPEPQPPSIACAEPVALGAAAADRAAWDKATRRSRALRATHAHATGYGVKVAVVDTGVAAHPRLHMSPHADMVSPDHPRADIDCDSHGTVVAGIIGMRADPDQDELVGIAPDAEILSVRQTSAHYRSPQHETAGNLANLAEAIHAALDAEAAVINVSVVSCVSPADAATLNTRDLVAAVQRAEENGVVIVAAAGNTSENCSPGDVVYPAHLPTVISVSAVDRPARGLADYALPASDSTGLRLSADGDVPVALSSTGSGLATGVYADNQQLRQYLGTSFAAPVVSGTVALMLQQQPHTSPAEIRQRLAAAADPARGSFDIHHALTHLETTTLPDETQRSITVTTAEADPTRGRVAMMAGLALAVIAVRAIIRGWRAGPST
ncbi:Subtilisin [Corynebacterium ciconiae DSM 44920]|uniref:S8 family serine peptidase n=1 Tax=Corynebacterium ciconiae TaxID=227319 RepID=UPI000382761B|nr:S8 family serine peptidase [Corynebacterium ciconiae]WKD60412.1 Subtilisin [Corynebacterium ciconiae DSM 44920]